MDHRADANGPSPAPVCRCSRRELWSALVREMGVLAGQAAGRQAGRLADLGRLPDHELTRLIPAVSPDCEIDLAQDWVCARFKSGPAVKLFAVADQHVLAVFNLFNGQNSLGQVARWLARQPDWQADEASAFVRALFLWLVGQRVCLPANAPR